MYQPMQERGRQLFNEGWFFCKEDGLELAKSHFDNGICECDDSKWQAVTLPHDWAISGPFDVKYDARCGGLPVHGIGWYRKHFTLTEEQKGQHIYVEFDGAMSKSSVWINGHHLGDRPCGYIGFEYDLTPYLYQDKENIITVRLAPEDLDARWYAGAGLYRNTWLKTKNSTRIAHWGNFITTPFISDQKALVNVEYRVNRSDSETAILDVEHTIFSAEGEIITSIWQQIDSYAIFRALP